MKKFLLLAMFIIAGFLTKAQSNIAATAISFTSNNSICQGATTMVQKLKLENVTADDSTYVYGMYYYMWNSPFTTVDSVIVRDTTGNLIGKIRMINGNCVVPINKWVNKTSPKFYNVFVRSTLTGTGDANMNLQGIQSTNGYDNMNYYTTYLYVADCNNPTTISVLVNFYNPLKNRDMINGDTIGYTSYSVTPNVTWTPYSNVITFYWYLNDSLIYTHATNTWGSYAPAVVFPLGKNKLKVVAKGVGVDSGSDSINFTVIPNNIYFKVMSYLPTDSICPSSGFYLWFNVISYNSQIKRLYWYQDSTQIYYWDSSFSFTNYSPNNGLNLTTPGIHKIKVLAFGEGPDRGVDSMMIFVKQTPKIKLTLSSAKICAGGNAILNLDTAGIKSFWFGNFSPNLTQFIIMHEGAYQLHIDWRMGCTSDTIIYITEYPSVDVPVISTSDCKAWVSTNADSIVWYKYQTRILNSNKVQIDITESDLYYAEVFNSYGCSKKSSLELVKCGHGQINCKILANVTNDTICPMNNFSISVSILTYTYPIKKGYLTMNGVVIHDWDSSSNWTINPPPISFTSSGIKKFKLFIFGDKQDVGVDSFTVYVIQRPQIKFSLTNDKICTGNVATMVLDTVGVKSFTFGSFSPLVNIFTISHGGQYSLHIEWRKGCSSDTVIYITECMTPTVPVISTADCIVWVTNTNNDSLVWHDFNTVIPNSNNAVLNITKPGFYSVKAYNKSGCSASSQMVLAECGHSAPMVCKIILNSSNLSICPTSSFSATASIVSYPYSTKRAYWTMDGVFILNWDTASNWSMNLNNLNLSSPGFHKLKLFVFGVGADKGSDSVILFVKQLPKIKLALTADKFCTGSSATATLDTVGIASFTFGSFASNKTQFTIQHEGQYKLHIDWRNGCSSDTSIFVTEYAIPDVPAINKRDCQVWISSQPGDSIAWYKYHVYVPNSNKDILNVTKPDFYSAKVFNKYGCNTESEMLYVECAARSGIKNGKGNEAIKIYPNPTKSILNIEGYSGTIILMDMMGKEVLRSHVKENNVIDISGLSSGMYIITSEDHYFMQKVVKN